MYREPLHSKILLDTISNSKAVALLFETTRRDELLYSSKTTFYTPNPLNQKNPKLSS